MKLLLEIILLTIAVNYVTLEEVLCPNVRGNLADIMKVGQSISEKFKDLCKKSPEGKVPKELGDELHKCFDNHLMPCINLNASDLSPIMQTCIGENGMLDADKMCDEKTQNSVMECGKSAFDKNKSKIMKAFTPRMGLISNKANKFKDCADKAISNHFP